MHHQTDQKNSLLSSLFPPLEARKLESSVSSSPTAESLSYHPLLNLSGLTYTFWLIFLFCEGKEKEK
jgi:hypothetical protein